MREKSVPARGHIKALSTLILFLLLSGCTPGKQELPSPELLAQYIHDKDYVILERTLRQLEVEDHQYLLEFIKEGDTLIGEHISTELTAIEVNTHQKYALLLIKANYWRRYLIFKLDGEKWKFFGEVVQVNHLQDPSHRVVTDSRGEAWLVIRYVMGHGTGVFSYGETWYSLNGKKMEEALVYAVENSVAGHPPEYPATVEVKGDVYYYDGVLDRSFNVRVSSEAAYSDRQGQPLFHIQQTRYYVWSPAANRFLQDMERPAHIQQEAEKVFPYLKDEFLLYAYDELLELAKDGNPAQKQWLQEVLNTATDSPERENLLEALNSQ